MSNPVDFDFGPDTVAEAYDTVLVPRIFEPWGRALISEYRQWNGKTVLDLAAGTGVVARLLAEQVGSSGRIVATDLNQQMLTRARQRCANAGAVVDFIVTPASPLAVPDESVDVAVCQQGFQFFPDRIAAARELIRVLRVGGRALTSTWCAVEDCVFFDWVCQALKEIGENTLDTMMRLPFDHITRSELGDIFLTAGFTEVSVERRTADFVLSAGVSEAVTVAYATPIGPHLSVLPKNRRVAFQNALRKQVESGSADGVTMGQLTAHVLTAAKPATTSEGV